MEKQAMEKQAITAMRVLTAEAIQKAKSGHPGLAIGSAPTGYTLFKHMKHNPAGHGRYGRISVARFFEA